MAKAGKAEPLDLGDVDRSVAYYLSIADGLCLQTFLTMVGGRARNARYIILSLIRQNPGVTQVELGSTNFRDKSSMSPIIAGFVADGIVRRERISRAGRPAMALFLTGKGEALLGELQPIAEDHIARMIGIMGESDHASLIALLRKLSLGLADLTDELARGRAAASQ
ncbi:MarR family winged helix-turn-helix transcriptional regulator [Sphingomonas profundi]|uniref:MarR family winged helix-turn-helix transcriptional regulator n=1 Tax=Alterirhizorhabdus profundi TaxID=2681549 RepID=UPI0012E6FC41|nr:MarR family winged helix-turn-helix transcriptional regulator [Sphingomonas profundi]